MADTTFTNAVTLTDADWFNDVNRLHYTIFGDPATAEDALAALQKKGANIASAATIDLDAATGDFVHITGSTGPITAITLASGDQVITVFDSTPTITHHATTLILPTGANIVAAANDIAIWRGDGSGNTRCVAYIRASAAVTSALLTMTSARLLGRSTAATGAIEEITVGSGLTLSGGSLTASSGSVTLGTPIATTSGTAHTFTGIPAGTKQITMNLVGVSLSGTDDLLIQIGDSGGLEATGYTSSAATGGAITSNTTGFIIMNSTQDAASTCHGSIILTLENSTNFTWAAMGLLIDQTGGVPRVNMSAGTKSLSAELTQISLTRTGSDTFDAGEINIAYE